MRARRFAAWFLAVDADGHIEVEDAERRLDALRSLRTGTSELLRLYEVERLHVVEPLRIYVPDLGVNGHCLVAAAPRALPQLALFRSLDDYVTFSDRSSLQSELSLRLGVSLLALTLHRVPDSLRHRSRRPRVAWVDVIPRVTRVASDGTAAAAEHTEISVMAACCRGLAGFLRRYGDRPRLCDEPAALTLVAPPVVHVEVYRDGRPPPSARRS